MKARKWLVALIALVMACTMGIAFAACEPVKPSGDDGGEDIVKLTVTYYDGASIITTREVEYGDPAPEIEAPEKDAHNFLGWFADPLHSAEYDFDAPIYKNTNIYAYYTQYKVYAATFRDAIPGVDGTDTLRGAEHSELVIPAAPVWEGHEFLGWKGSDGTLKNPGEKILLEGELDLAFTASWAEYTFEHVTANAATCTHAGNPDYYTCSACGKHFTAEDHLHEVENIVEQPTGHDYGDPVWHWEGTTATATFTCTKCEDEEGHEVTKEATVNEGVITKPATCTVNGDKTYTATVEFNGTHTDTHVEVGVVAATGHSYGDPTWKWEGLKATATFTCTKCEDEDGHVVEKEATVDGGRVTKEANCTEAGDMTYTATVEFNGTHKDEHVEVGAVEKKAHVYGEPTWTLNDEKTTMTATFTCENCTEGVEGHTETRSAEATLSTETKATCVAQGEATYTATVEFENAQHEGTVKVTLDIDSTAHSWASGWTSDKTGHWHKCENGCEEKGEFTAHDSDTLVNHACKTCNYNLDETKYYIVGSMNSWTYSDHTYPLTQSDEGGNKFTVEIDLAPGNQFQIAHGDSYEGQIGFSALKGGNAASSFEDVGDFGGNIGLKATAKTGTYRITLVTDPEAKTSEVSIDLVKEIVNYEVCPFDYYLTGAGAGGINGSGAYGSFVEKFKLTKASEANEDGYTVYTFESLRMFALDTFKVIRKDKASESSIVWNKALGYDDLEAGTAKAHFTHDGDRNVQLKTGKNGDYKIMVYAKYVGGTVADAYISIDLISELQAESRDMGYYLTGITDWKEEPNAYKLTETSTGATGTFYFNKAIKYKVIHVTGTFIGDQVQGYKAAWSKDASTSDGNGSTSSAGYWYFSYSKSTNATPTASRRYKIAELGEFANGSVTVSPKQDYYEASTTITVTLTPEEGYLVGSFKINGSEKQLTESEGVYTYKFTYNSLGQSVSVKDTTITATFLKKITITYKLNAEDGAPETKVIGATQSADTTAPAAEKIPTGYTFDGWYLDGGTKYEGAALEEDTTLTAHWNPIEYTVKYSTDQPGATLPEEHTLTLAEGNDSFTPEAAKFKGYDFGGWKFNDEPLQDGKFTLTTELIEGLEGGTEFTLTGEFTATVYTFDFVVNKPAEAEEEVSFTSAKPESVSLVSATVTLPTVSLKGYAFLGWKFNDTDNLLGSWTLTVEKIPETTTLTFTAQWEKVSDVETFRNYTFAKGSYGDQTPGDDTTVPAAGQASSFSGFLITLPDESQNPVWEGYEFLGWKVDGGAVSDPGASVIIPADNTVITAAWAKQITVYWHLDEDTTQHVYSEEKPASLGDCTLTLEKDDYVLDGWYTTEDYSGNRYEFDATALKADEAVAADALNLYARWIRKSITVTFMGMDGTTAATQTYTTDESDPKPSVVDTTSTAHGTVKRFFTFQHWSSEQDADQEFVSGTEVIDNLTLYAWCTEDTSDAYVAESVDNRTYYLVGQGRYVSTSERSTLNSGSHWNTTPTGTSLVFTKDPAYKHHNVYTLTGVKLYEFDQMKLMFSTTGTYDWDHVYGAHFFGLWDSTRFATSENWDDNGELKVNQSGTYTITLITKRGGTDRASDDIIDMEFERTAKVSVTAYYICGSMSGSSWDTSKVHDNLALKPNVSGTGTTTSTMKTWVYTGSFTLNAEFKVIKWTKGSTGSNTFNGWMAPSSNYKITSGTGGSGTYKVIYTVGSTSLSVTKQ